MRKAVEIPLPSQWKNVFLHLCYFHSPLFTIGSIKRFVDFFKFAVSEDEVWRAVLRWARTNTGINKPTPQWTDDDRATIMQVGKVQNINIS